MAPRTTILLLPGKIERKKESGHLGILVTIVTARQRQRQFSTIYWLRVLIRFLFLFSVS